MHVFDSRYPFAPGAQPVPPAPMEQYLAVQSLMGTTRTVVVAPSSYGLDNRSTLDGLAALGAEGRAVVSLAPGATDAELAELHAAGVRGVRLNLARGQSTPFDTLAPIARRIAPLGWHVQLMLTPQQLVAHGDALAVVGVSLVIDHMARIPQDGGVDSPAYTVLRRLVDAGNTWVKLSLASSAQLLGTSREEVLHTLGRQLVVSSTGRLVWGSDWPHVLSTLEGTPQPADEDMLALLLDWASAEAQRREILADTPAALYGFAAV
ncbi:amidohydrolase family protein [Xylophilus sp. ASV27]|uniref:amidohydrolase family protein n=1 Tax=Xylophilus sp. ASV27 TaxID=2795129 RepID=UPI0018ED49C0|nr:amidohydrolase family protein [Xylophilus sp. ASV27]